MALWFHSKKSTHLHRKSERFAPMDWTLSIVTNTWNDINMYAHVYNVSVSVWGRVFNEPNKKLVFISKFFLSRKLLKIPIQESRLDKRCANWTMPGRDRRTTDEEGMNQIDTIVPSPQPRNVSRGPNQMITRVSLYIWFCRIFSHTCWRNG